jgi:hypothetical protein
MITLALGLSPPSLPLPRSAHIIMAINQTTPHF